VPIAALIAALGMADLTAKTISRYERYFAVSTSSLTLSSFIALRKCEVDGVSHLLLADPSTLRTFLMPAQEFHSVEMPFFAIRERYAHTPYCAALADVQKQADKVLDAGITHCTPQGGGVDLTVDLCPSRRPLDRDFFKDCVKAFGSIERPLPLAVSLSGVWMRDHAADARWLFQYVNDTGLCVAWVNHSFHHRVGKGLSLRQKFLLEKGTNMDEEILETEKAMLRLGAVPSVFFRFPGLVSSAPLINTVISYGLIPLGSDAWLAKNQKPVDGSIVLVHANGNEPIGIQRFFGLLREKKQTMESGQWKLLDLRESVKENEEKKSMQ
jgi:hypothetical protein